MKKILLPRTKPFQVQTVLNALPSDSRVMGGRGTRLPEGPMVGTIGTFKFQKLPLGPEIEII